MGIRLSDVATFHLKVGEFSRGPFWPLLSYSSETRTGCHLALFQSIRAVPVFSEQRGSVALVTCLLPRRCRLVAAPRPAEMRGFNEDSPFAYQLLTGAALPVGLLLSSQGHSNNLSCGSV